MRNASNATTPKDSESLSYCGLSGQHPVDEPQGLRADPGPTKIFFWKFLPENAKNWAISFSIRIKMVK